MWTKLGLALAQAIGRIGQGRELQARLQEAAGPASALMMRLADESTWRVLDQARGNRNTRVHGGVLPLPEVESRIATLEALLSDAEQALAAGFEDVSPPGSIRAAVPCGARLLDLAWPEQCSGGWDHR